MSNASLAVLKPIGKGRIALQSVQVDPSLQGLCSEVSLSQRYKNLESINIEAVYTFPLPLDALLAEHPLPRLVAQRRLADLDPVAARQLAVEYQLVTAQTSCVLVYQREADQKAEAIPALRKVP